MKKILILLILLTSFLQAEDLEKVSLQLQWKHQFEFAGFYAAKEKGFYKDAGLEVELVEFKRGDDIVSKVVNQEVEFGLTYSSLISEYLRGKPVVFVANYLKQSPLVFVTQKYITNPSELKNKTFMGVSDEIDDITLKILLYKFGLESSQINSIDTDFSLKQFIDKKVDAMTIFTTNELYKLEMKNVEYNIINSSLYGYEYYDLNLFTSSNFAVNHASLVTKFKEASNKGWEYALNNKSEIIELILKKYNTQNKTKDALIFESKQMQQLMLTQNHVIGSIKKERVEFISDNILEVKYVEDNRLYSIDEFIFNDKIIDDKKDITNFTKEEKAFLTKNKNIRVYMDYSYPPYSFVEEDKLYGFSIEYANLLASLLGVDFEYIYDITWDNAVKKLEKKEIDVIGQMVNTKSRREFALFTQNYYHYFTGTLSRKGEVFKTLSDLDGKTVGLVKGYYEEELLLKYYPNINVKTYEDNVQLIYALLNNEFDAVIETYQVLEYLVNKMALQNKLTYIPLKVESVFGVTKEAFGIRKDWSLFHSAMNKVITLTKMQKKQIEEKWLNGNKKIFFNEKQQIYLDEKQYISMCIDPNWEPYEYIGNNGNHIGLVSDFIKIIEKKIGKEIKLIPTLTWAESIDSIKEEKCEIISFLNKSTSREKYLNFTNTLYSEPDVIVTRNDVTYIDGYNALHDKTVGVMKGHATDEYIRTNHPKIKLKYLKNHEEGLLLVSDGTIFATINSLLGATHLIKKQNLTNVKIAGKSEYINEYHIAVNKKDKILLDILTKAVDKISENEKNKIINNWTSIKYEQGMHYDVLINISIIFLLIFSFLYYRSNTVKKLNANLEQRVKREVQKNRDKDKLMLSQSRLAQMGEVISMIAHQWRQPLNSLSLLNQTVLLKYDRGKLNDEAIEFFRDHSKKQIHEMSKTIDDFKDFFKPQKVQSVFSLNKMIDNLLEILKPIFINNNVQIHLNSEEEYFVKGYQNELGQALLNIFNNSKDALIENEIVKKELNISVYRVKDTINIAIADNAGGIPKDIIENIFDPYFSTKHDKNGTGLGLYMTKTIIEEHMDGKITVKNDKFGAVFTIILKNQINNQKEL